MSLSSQEREFAIKSGLYRGRRALRSRGSATGGEKEEEEGREKEDAKVAHSYNVALTDATERQKPSPWTRNMFSLYACLLLATLNSCINGYDGSLMAGINTYEQYRVYFNFPIDKGTPSTGIVYAIYTIGNLLGSFAAGPATDFRGRKWGMFIGSAVIVLGTAIQATCTHLSLFMLGRFTLGFGVAICASAGPAYVSEMAHPSYRGTMTGIYNTFWFLGGIPGAFVPFATSTLPGTASWRLPIWLQIVFSGAVLLGSPFLPETPRWLIANDRHEEALDVMARFHGEGCRDSPIVQLEYKEMVEDISVTGADKRWWDYRELFDSRETRYRTLLVAAMAVFGQWSGNGPVSYFYPTMLRGAGIEGNNIRLLYNGMQNIVSFGGAMVGAVFTDRWGRRPQLLVSTFVIVVLFAAIAALNATNLRTDGVTGAYITLDDGTIAVQRPAQAKAIIGLIFIFGFVYSAGYTPLQALYPVECLRYESRAKGMGFNNFVINLAGFYNTFVTEIAFTGAGWKYYILFIGWDSLEFVFIYFFFVETRRRTLEELTEIFCARKPVRASLSRTAVLVRDSEGVMGVLDE
ncbi:general substrate transporter [Pseudovirgaria hyperparasitica]|uniref:General substrate transporter n=1 Tax=Pseudovirgaria hyperparasitica TaxID=470096 RepID=A0A6A6W1I5_9PEZI|nr:general substrate transporter [Pseudovirgaria hyperparasitica]KAF2756395.1 general substrate transporter [Pseudovirgaria hyperparasitica]